MGQHLIIVGLTPSPDFQKTNMVQSTFSKNDARRGLENFIS